MKSINALDDSLLVIAGPTASGKTDIGIELARAFDGEVISADSRQIYRYMDIGTAKPTPQERDAVPHHLIDIVNPDESYSAAQFAVDAARVILEIQSRNRIPILVGGSGFYLEALIDGFSPIPDVPEGIRNRLMEEARTNLPALYLRLSEVDPVLADRLHPNDRQRIVRGLEVHEATGEKLTDLQTLPRERAGEWPTTWFALDIEREALYKTINNRVDQMIAEGLVVEVEQMIAKGFGIELAAVNTFGYQEVHQYLAGEISQEEAVEQIKIGTRHYAKRQLTWFRRNTRITWVDNSAGRAAQTILKSLDTNQGSG
jgi:tRNA dimethylallyltransferase